MTPDHCALCDQKITPDNDSREHIIPQAIGGRAVARGFLCRACNNKRGSEWDAALAEQLAPWCLLFGIKRSNGSVPSQKFQTLHGKPVIGHVEGYWTPAAPSCKKTEQGYHVEVPKLKEARQMIKGLKKRHPEQPWTVDQLLAGAMRTRPFNDLCGFELNFGGAQTGRSIVKSALALAFDAGVAPGECDAALAYLRQAEGEPCFDYYYGTDLVRNRETEVPLHCVYVRGNPERKTLMAYIEIFSGLHRMVVWLSRKYTGPALQKCYALNPVTGQKVQVEIAWQDALEEPLPPLTNEILQEHINNFFIPILEAALATWNERTMEYEIAYTWKATLQEVGKKEGDPVTEEECRQIARAFSQRLEPMLLSRLRQENDLKGIIQIGDDFPFDPCVPIESHGRSPSPMDTSTRRQPGV